ncbi:MAG: hypothetical protein ACE5G2_05145, partial [Candidatus Krumholzibacteriia bacterium]
GTLSLTYESRRADIDQDEPANPRNPQTRVEEARSLKAEVTQELSQTWKMRIYADVQLNQGFYAHPGPQGLGDRDELRSRLGMDMDGRIHRKVTGRVQMYVRAYDQAFIDRRRSANSRDETEYVVRPSFRYQVTPKISIQQLYGLSSKVLDEIYDPSRNTLNRSHFLQSSVNYQMTSRLTLDMRFDYLLQDNGLYVQNPRATSGQRIFSPTIGLGVRYALIRNGRLTFTSSQVATRERRTSFTGGRATGQKVTERGNLALGLESKIEIGDLKLDTKFARNQSFNVSLNRNVFFNVQSSLSYTF